MSKADSIFGNGYLNDLGTDNIGDDKSSVDTMLERAYLDTSNKCIVCGQPAEYKLVPKPTHLDTEDCRKRGYVCKHHLLQFSKADYGIRDLKK